MLKRPLKFAIVSDIKGVRKMAIKNCDVNVKIETSPIVEEQILKATINSKPKMVRLETDSKGNVIIDKEVHPELYDWAVNG